MAGALLTDLYELNMAASYLRRQMTGEATFSLFVRRLPAERGFLVVAGVEDCLDVLEAFSFDERDLSFLSTLGFDDESIQRFSCLRFTGEVRAVPEGRIVFADEPLLEVTAPIAEAQLVETILLNQMSFQTTLASKAARCRVAGARARSTWSSSVFAGPRASRRAWPRRACRQWWASPPPAMSRRPGVTAYALRAPWPTATSRHSPRARGVPGVRRRLSRAHHVSRRHLRHHRRSHPRHRSHRGAGTAYRRGRAPRQR